MVSMERVACKLHFTLKISLRSPVIPVKPCPTQSAQAGAHASAGRDMVVHRRVWLGQAKFSVQAGQVRIANVKLGERASFVRQRRHLKVLAVIAYKTDRGVVKTRRTFTVVSA
jgi:hypothetical protein